MLKAPVALTCVRSISSTNERGTASPWMPASPSKGAALKIQWPVRSDSTSQLPSGESPHPAQPLAPTTSGRRSARKKILIVVFGAKVSDELLAAEMAERILELHQLNEEVVLGVQPRRRHRALEVEREPLLDAAHARALRQVHE